MNDQATMINVKTCRERSAKQREDADDWSRKTVLFPANRLGAKGSLITRIRAIPKDVQVVLARGTTWWLDCSFRPLDDTQLLISARPQVPALHWSFRDTRGLLSVCCIKSDKIESKGLKRTNTVTPHVVPHPRGRALVFLGERGCVSTMLLDSPNRIATEIEVTNADICGCDVTSDGCYVACVTKRTYPNDVFFTLELMSTQSCKRLAYVNCCSLHRAFRGTPQHGNNVACKFSADCNYIGLAISSGELIVVERQSFKRFRTLVPGVLPGMNIRLSNENCFDFNPASGHKLLTFAGRDNHVYFCDTDGGKMIYQVPVNLPGSVDCIKYTRSGEILAVALAGFRVVLLNALSGSTVSTIDASSRYSYDQIPNVLKMSFNHFGSVLATASSDGYIELWNTMPDIRLQHLCRCVIIQNTRYRDLRKLPLPKALKMFLLQKR